MNTGSTRRPPSCSPPGFPSLLIALNAGFENMSYFIRQFRRCKGCTPSAYRNTEDPKSLPIPF
ncbi:MAG: helix-turn-helix domain-containing protein [Lachnospiraceae bacterium]